MGNLFSDAGLVARGFNDAGQDNARLAEMERANAFNAQADPMRLETTRMGLEEARRTTAAAAAMRNAVSGVDPATGRLGVTQAAAEAARGSGNLEQFSALSAQIPLLQREGWTELVRGALTGMSPEQAVQNFNRMGAGRISGAEWGKDPKSGDVLMNLTDAATGQKQVFNATKMYDLFNPQKSDVHSIPAGGMGIVTTPGKAPQTFRAPVNDQFDVKDGIMFNKNTGTWQQVDTKGDWHLGTITNGDTEVPVRVNRRDGIVEALGPGGQRTGLPQAHVTFSPTGGAPMITIGNKVMEFKPATEASPGSSGFLGFGGSSAIPGQPARLEPVQQPETPPVAGAMKAPDGKWYLQKQDGKFYPVVPRSAAPVAPQLPSNVPPEDEAAYNAVRTSAFAGSPITATVNRQMSAKEQAGLQPSSPAPSASQADVRKTERAAPSSAIPQEYFDAQGNYIGASPASEPWGPKAVEAIKEVPAAMRIMREEARKALAASLKKKMVAGLSLTQAEQVQAKELGLIPVRKFKRGGMVNRQQAHGLA